MAAADDSEVYDAEVCEHFADVGEFACQSVPSFGFQEHDAQIQLLDVFQIRSEGARRTVRSNEQESSVAREVHVLPGRQLVDEEADGVVLLEDLVCAELARWVDELLGNNLLNSLVGILGEFE